MTPAQEQSLVDGVWASVDALRGIDGTLMAICILLVGIGLVLGLKK